MHPLVNLALQSFLVFIVADLLDGVHISSFLTAVGIALALGIVNLFIRPILLIGTLPLNVLTLGLFTFVINALMILLVSAVIPGFTVENFWYALSFTLIISGVKAIIRRMS